MSILLNNQWTYPLCCNGGTLTTRSIFCVRCDIVQQRRLLRPIPGTAEMHQLDSERFAEEEKQDRLLSEWVQFAFVVIGDVLTAGCPFGFYHGLGTASYGCWTRWLVRRHFRIDGYGWIDLMTMLFFPSCAVAQHRLEIAKDGLVPPSPLSME